MERWRRSGELPVKGETHCATGVLVPMDGWGVGLSTLQRSLPRPFLQDLPTPIRGSGPIEPSHVTVWASRCRELSPAAERSVLGCSHIIPSANSTADASCGRYWFLRSNHMIACSRCCFERVARKPAIMIVMTPAHCQIVNVPLKRMNSPMHTSGRLRRLRF